MNVTLCSPIAFENWNFSSPDDPGIGGSETAVVETAWRLARRGHEVVVYAPIPSESPSEWRGTRWLPITANGERPQFPVDYSRPGLWLISRDISVLDNFPVEHPGQHLALTAQDVHYAYLNEERWKKLDRFIALCPTHQRFTKLEYPKFAHKVSLGFNGIRRDIIEEIESVNLPPRNPRRIIFASSPDRGLLNLLRIFKKARQWIHDLELVIAYGFDNISKIVASRPPTDRWRKLMEEILREVHSQPGITWLGRIGQRQLARENLSSAMTVHPTLFEETGGISFLEGMACGAIPIISPTWAVGDYVKHGVWVYGNPDSSMTHARYIGEIYRLASNVGLQERIRKDMMPSARGRFDWERYIDIVETWMGVRPKYSIVFLCYDPEGKLKEMTGKSLDLIKRHSPEAEIIFADEKGECKSVNAAFAKARGQFIFLVCSDIMIDDPNWLETLADPEALTSWGPRTSIFTGEMELEMSLYCVPRSIYEALSGKVYDEVFDGGYGCNDDSLLANVRKLGFPTKIKPVKATHLCGKTYRTYYDEQEFRRMHTRNVEIYKTMHADIVPFGGWMDYHLPEKI
jgi:glycosyltransferase involved in cell wall biosynthesis